MAQALSRAWRPHGETVMAKRFLLVWSVVVFCFFSASGSKLASYILPMFPALALLAGEFLARIERKALIAHLVLAALAAAVAIGLSTAVPGFARDPAQQAATARYALWLGGAASLWLVGSVAALLFAWRGLARTALLMLSATALAAGMATLLGHDVFAPTSSSYYLARQLPPTLNRPFYSLRMYDQTLPFYLDRTLTLVEYRDELSFGLDSEPEKGLPTIAAFVERWNGDREAYAVMGEATYQELAKENLPMLIVARDAHRIVVRTP